MNPFKLLKQDHKKVKELFQEFESLGDRSYKQKQKVVHQAIQELEIHTQIEEEIFYPAVRDNAEKEGQKLVAESYEEHAVVKKLMDEMQQLEPEDEKFDAKFKVIRDSVKHHIKEEEGELFPLAKNALGDQVDEIAEQLEDRKMELMNSRGMEMESEEKIKAEGFKRPQHNSHVSR